MENNTIEVIKTIGSQWKFLLVVFFIIIFIVKWKTIWSFVNNFTQIRVKRGQTEFEMHRQENKEDNETTNQEKAIPKGDSLEDENEDLQELENGDNVFFQYHEALREKKFKDADELLDRVLAEIEDPNRKKEEFVRNFYLRHKYGDTSAFRELEEYTENIENDDEKKSHGFFYLSLIYNQANNYPKAVELATKALELTNKNEQKAYCISRISDYHLENENTKESLDVIIKHIDNINEKQPKVTLYRALANYYKKTENKLLESIAYQKALELTPNNTYLLFDAAYNYSETEQDLKDLGLLFYKKLLGFDSKFQSALNNIGVAYKNLGLEIKSIEHYKKAFEFKNSLAASNIAYQLIHLGFIEEAEDYLKKAEEFENPHENVFEATSSIKTKITKEKEEEEKILNKANKKFRFFNHFGNAVFTSKKIDFKISNNWHYGEIPITISKNENLIEFSWENGEEKHSISGVLTNNSISATYKKPKKNIYSYSAENRYTYRDVKGFGYLVSNQKITFIFEFESKIIELNFYEK
ncbi:hypothetical protein GCM10007028_20880 [Algibacter mikhailovii]|uniref:Tetratricopeptide repeat protein n=1 Tax=Algibacter mikhailovii TaxID=425498 RepID=A0A918R390_9FLAO|nr:hypothetical protein GCM10007028_20880 [Algibacter mikhailovii]